MIGSSNSSEDTTMFSRILSNPRLLLSARMSVHDLKKSIQLGRKGRFSVLNEAALKFVLTEDFENVLISSEGPWYVVSVSGVPLIGKSTILNLIITLINHFGEDSTQQKDLNRTIRYLPIFETGDGIESTTEGTDFFYLKYKDKNVLFLDIEGNNDPSRGQDGTWIYTNHLITALAISHTHLYNCTYFEQSSFSNFNTANEIIEQNRFHDFILDVKLIKRNHESCEEFWDQDLNRIMDRNRTIFDGLKANHKVCIFPRPPQHITSQWMTNSCIRLLGETCESCENDFFFKKLKKFTLELLDDITVKPLYSNGNELLSTIRQVLECNHRSLPFSSDQGYIPQFRAVRLERERQRINERRQELIMSYDGRELVNEMRQLTMLQPRLFPENASEMVASFVHPLMSLFSQIEFLRDECSNFVKQCLEDKFFTIINPTEKQAMLEVYVKPFEDHLKSLKEHSQDFEQFISQIDFNTLRREVNVFLSAYKTNTYDANAQTGLATVSTVSSCIFYYIARQVAMKVVFVGGFATVAGCLVVLSALAAKKAVTMLRDGKKKAEEKLDLNQLLNGVHAESREALEKISKFLEEKVVNLEKLKKNLHQNLGGTEVEEERKDDDAINVNGRELLFTYVEEALERKLEKRDFSDLKDKIESEFDKVDTKIQDLRGFLSH